MDSCVALLLSTYNGEIYITDLLDSLRAQSYCNYHLFVRDDGSSDKTLSIISTYPSNSLGTGVTVSAGQNIGVVKSFETLMLEAAQTRRFQYYMFVDQDDVWLPNKIELMLAKMHEMESRLGKDGPLLVHSDLVVVDSNLKQLSPSLWRYQNLDPRKCSTRELLFQNVVTGCASAFNAAALNKSVPFPSNAIMHDWWMALVISIYGHIGVIDAPTILYRQHTNNEIGASQYSPKTALRAAASRKRWERQFRNCIDQALALCTFDTHRSNGDWAPVVRLLECIPRMPVLIRPFVIPRVGRLKQGLLRNVAVWWYLLRVRSR